MVSQSRLRRTLIHPKTGDSIRANTTTTAVIDVRPPSVSVTPIAIGVVIAIVLVASGELFAMTHPGDRVAQSIGVAMSLTHDWITGMPPGDGKTVTDHAVAFRLPGLENL